MMIKKDKRRPSASFYYAEEKEKNHKKENIEYRWFLSLYERKETAI